MLKTKDASKKARAHTIYKLEDGTKVPGVTTVLGILNKPALVKWANNLGLQGIDSNKYRDEMADIGTLAHQMIVNYFNKVETDTTDMFPLDDYGPQTELGSTNSGHISTGAGSDDHYIPLIVHRHLPPYVEMTINLAECVMFRLIHNHGNPHFSPDCVARRSRWR